MPLFMMPIGFCDPAEYLAPLSQPPAKGQQQQPDEAILSGALSVVYAHAGMEGYSPSNFGYIERTRDGEVGRGREGGMRKAECGMRKRRRLRPKGALLRPGGNGEGGKGKAETELGTDLNSEFYIRIPHSKQFTSPF